MKIVYFTHSLVSCWNHGNAHFLRGLLRELIASGHEVLALEPSDSWSRSNLAAEQGFDPTPKFLKTFPDLQIVAHYNGDSELEQLVDGAELVIVHEWTDPRTISSLGRMKLRGFANFTLLFHDTHHRAVSDPKAIRQMDLSGYDGVLAFGKSLAEIYRSAGWGNRVFVFHEAADTRLFTPPSEERGTRKGAVWVGNWGDGERTEELKTFLLRPAHRTRIPLDVYGVRYPQEALATLRDYGATYKNWLPNDTVPTVFAHHLFTVHVPRRYYAERLPGIPTIRVFEALACGLPLVCAPWLDAENLFRSEDYLTARNEQQMTEAMNALAHDGGLRSALSKNGLETIRQRHTCAHRADELLTIVEQLRTEYRGAA
jgi:spore maturation protein CgeB